ncbi:hypothetical protein AAY473_007591, partial [Plecturocebus cupreus]
MEMSPHPSPFTVVPLPSRKCLLYEAMHILKKCAIALTCHVALHSVNCNLHTLPKVGDTWVLPTCRHQIQGHDKHPF